MAMSLAGESCARLQCPSAMVPTFRICSAHHDNHQPRVATEQLAAAAEAEGNEFFISADLIQYARPP